MHVSAHWLAVRAWRRGDRHCRVLIFIFIGFPLPLPLLPLPLGVVLLVRVLALVSVVFVVDVSFGVGGCDDARNFCVLIWFMMMTLWMSVFVGVRCA